MTGGSLATHGADTGGHSASTKGPVSTTSDPVAYPGEHPSMLMPCPFASFPLKAIREQLVALLGCTAAARDSVASRR